MTVEKKHDMITENNRIPFLMMLLPGILGTALAYQILFISEETEEKMMTWGQAVSILVAVISVFGVLVVGFWQLKRDGKTIDQISEKTSTIKEKATLLEKDVSGHGNLLERSSANLEYLSRDITAMSKWADTIHALGVELEVQKRLQKEYSDSVTNKDVVIAEINVLYQTNAILREENRMLKEDVRSRDHKIRQLEQELERKNQKLARDTPAWDNIER